MMMMMMRIMVLSSDALFPIILAIRTGRKYAVKAIISFTILLFLHIDPLTHLLSSSSLHVVHSCPYVCFLLLSNIYMSMSIAQSKDNIRENNSNHSASAEKKLSVLS